MDAVMMFMLENVKPIRTDFSAGWRKEPNLTLPLTNDQAEQMFVDQWPVVYLQTADNGPPQPTITVFISPEPALTPSVRLQTDWQLLEMPLFDIGELDIQDIKSVSIVVHGYNREKRGQTGVRALIHFLKVVI